MTPAIAKGKAILSAGRTALDAFPERAGRMVVAAPAVVYVLYTALLAVNVPHWDDFNKLPIVSDMLHGRLTFQELWQQQNEHRIIVPLVLELVVARLSHYDLRLEMLLGASYLIAAAFVFIATQRRYLTPAVAFAPLTLLLFSLIQYQNMLIGWTSVDATLLALAVTLYCLERRNDGRVFFPLAIVAAVLGSFCSLQGLFIWASAFPYLAPERVGSRRAVAWLSAGAVTALLWFPGFNFNDAAIALTRFAPDMIPFFTIEFGGLFSGPSLATSSSILFAVLLGALLLGSCAYAIWSAVRAAAEQAAFRLPFALLIFAAAAAGFTAYEHNALGLAEAAASRFTTYSLLLPIAVYLILVQLWRTDRTLRHAFSLGAFGVLVAWQAMASLAIGIGDGRAVHDDRLEAADAFVNYRLAGDDLIKRYLWCCPQLVRTAAANAEQDDLSTFSTVDAARYLRIGIIDVAGSTYELPPPPALAATIARDPVAAKGWGALASEYGDDDRLRRQFALTAPSGSAGLLSWAAIGDYGSPKAALILAPYTDLYRELAAALPSRAPARAYPPNPHERADLDSEQGRSGWYLPFGTRLDAARGQVIVERDDADPRRYIPSDDIPVLPERSYRIEATIDARRARDRAPCFYLAEVPSGYGRGMTCGELGRRRHFATTVTIGTGVWRAQWVAYLDHTAIPFNAPVVYSDIRLAIDMRGAR